MSTNRLFKIGDIVLLNDTLTTELYLTKSERKVFNQKPDALLIVDYFDKKYMTSLVYLNFRKYTRKFESISGDSIYVNVDKFYCVSGQCFKNSGTLFLKDQFHSIRLIKYYNMQKRLAKKEEKEERLREIIKKRKKKRLLKIKNKIRENKENRVYKQQIEISIINNEIAEVDNVLKKVGCDPRFKSSRRQGSNDVKYVCYNPKSYSGGKFSPK